MEFKKARLTFFKVVQYSLRLSNDIGFLKFLYPNFVVKIYKFLCIFGNK